MIANGVYILNQDSTIMGNMSFPKGQEIEIVSGVVYIRGLLVDTQFQSLILNWMENNKNLLTNDTRH